MVFEELRDQEIQQRRLAGARRADDEEVRQITLVEVVVERHVMLGREQREGGNRPLQLGREVLVTSITCTNCAKLCEVGQVANIHKAPTDDVCPLTGYAAS